MRIYSEGSENQNKPYILAASVLEKNRGITLVETIFDDSKTQGSCALDPKDQNTV